jgi:hypothetical protein
LGDDEIRVASGSFMRIGRPFGPIAQLLLLTGARRDEIASGSGPRSIFPPKLGR